MDDYFPCSKKTRVPIFAKPNGPELWVMLLEKAWAGPGQEQMAVHHADSRPDLFPGVQISAHVGHRHRF